MLKEKSKTRDQLIAEATSLYSQLLIHEKRWLQWLFPDNTFVFPGGRKMPARSLYKKTNVFWEAGQTFKQRLMMGGNRTSKTLGFAVELRYHLTGKYPTWWKGKRYTKESNWWLAGKDRDSVNQVLQQLLLGPVKEFGTGVIPAEDLDFDTLTEATKSSTHIKSFRVKHVSGNYSVVEFKTYEQGREPFQGTERNIWLDEQVPQDIYSECLLRTMTGDCMLVMTFTPLLGMTDVVRQFTNDGDYSEGDKGHSRHLTMVGWDDAPHLSKEEQEKMLAGIQPYQLQARKFGIPLLGSGAIYPMYEKCLVEMQDIFEIPRAFKRVYAMDFGWTNPTAILWGAIDPNTDVMYLYKEHYHSGEGTLFHATTIINENTKLGFPIPGVCDPSGGGTNSNDGKNARKNYLDYKIEMQSADNSVEPGIALVIDRMLTGKLKIFKTCTNLLKEFSMYARDEKGKVVKVNDHLMDALRYLCMTGTKIAKSPDQFHNEKHSADFSRWDAGRDQDLASLFD